MTDAGYVAGGYAVTVVAIGGYVAHLWLRNRSLARAGVARPGPGPAPDHVGPDHDGDAG